ncbi:hypothetical protein PG990_009827 [Apiospora arundinis]
MTNPGGFDYASILAAEQNFDDDGDGALPASDFFYSNYEDGIAGSNFKTPGARYYHDTDDSVSELDGKHEDIDEYENVVENEYIKVFHGHHGFHGFHELDRLPSAGSCGHVNARVAQGMSTPEQDSVAGPHSKAGNKSTGRTPNSSTRKDKDSSAMKNTSLADSVQSTDVNRGPNPDLEVSHKVESADPSYLTDGNESDRDSSLNGPSTYHNSNHVPSLVSAWLESIQEHQDYSAIARACKGFWDQELDNADGPETRREATASLIGNDAPKPHGNRGKRKAAILDGSQGESSSTKPKLSAQSHGSANKGPPFACPFFKKDRHAYSSCSNTKIHKINHVAEHLRKVHELGDTTCPDCWGPFEGPEQLADHKASNTCQPTNGTPVHELVVPKTKNQAPRDKWYIIFRQLFPQTDPPESPFWQPYEPSATELFTHIERNLPAELSGTIPEEHVKTVVQRVRTLWDNFRNTNVEFLNTQQATPAFSFGSVDETSSVTNASSLAEHQVCVERFLKMRSSPARGPERDSSRSRPTPKPSGVELTLPAAHNDRQIMEGPQPFDFPPSTFIEVSGASSSSYFAFGPGLHIGESPEEHRSNGMSSISVEASPGTNSQMITHDMFPNHTMHETIGNFDLTGLHSESGDLDQYQFDDISNFDDEHFWLNLEKDFSC